MRWFRSQRSLHCTSVVRLPRPWMLSAVCMLGLMFALVPGGCGSGHGSGTTDSWAATKASQLPINELPMEFSAPVPQALATLAWEDGVYISRDGLALYCVYLQMDALSAVMAAVNPDQFYLYRRGPDIGQDFTNPIAGDPHPWLHGDVAYATRASTAESFTAWSLSGLGFRFYNRGAPQGLQNDIDPNTWNVFAFTEDSSGRTKIRFVTNVPRNPNATGGILDLPANVDEPAYRQDNPHVEYIVPGDPNQLVLFYESDDKPGGAGSNDLWYTTTADGAISWADPLPVTTVNTPDADIQPHLYHDGTAWWLYFASTNPADGKLGIFRAVQQNPGDWDSWGTRELVVSAGAAAGVGEPTLTAYGDLSFVVVTENASGTDHDRFDSDPWFLPKR
jgi:hypothetical protein